MTGARAVVVGPGPVGEVGGWLPSRLPGVMGPVPGFPEHPMAADEHCLTRRGLHVMIPGLARPVGLWRSWERA